MGPIVEKDDCCMVPSDCEEDDEDGLDPEAAEYERRRSCDAVDIPLSQR
jgi:hypothetical protein